MPHTRRLFVNGSFAILEEAAITLLRSLKSAGDPLAPLWVVVPTNLLRLRLARRIAKGSVGHVNLRLLTLLDLARELAEPALLAAGATPLSDLAALALLRRLLRDQPGEYFAALVDRPGLHAALLATFNDLADGDVDAPALGDFVARLPRDSVGRDRLAAVARLYRAYCDERSRLKHYDANDLLRAATARVTSQPPPGEQIVLYGFYDFTALQRRLVAAATNAASSIAFFPWEAGPRFAYATPTLSWFRSLGFDVTPLASEGEATTDLGHGQADLFDGPSPSERARRDPDGTLSVISAPGEGREMREVARAILRLVRERGLRFDEIAVLLRGREPYANQLAELLPRCGVPVYLEGGRPLHETRAGRALLLLLQVVQENFARPTVIEFVTTAPIPFATLLADGDRCTPAQWDVLSAEAGIVAGRAQWTERLAALRRRHQAQQQADEDPPPWVSARLAEIDRCQRFIEHLASDLDRIPRHGTWRDLVEGVLAAFARYVEHSEDAERVRKAVTPLAHFDAVAGEGSFGDVVTAVSDALSGANEPVGVFGRGIFIGDIMPARGLSFRVALIPGMVERGVPRPAQEDPLFLDEERQYLGERTGRSVVQKQARFDEERLLFTLMLRSAVEAAVLSFPRLDMSTARDRLPSVYLLHLCTAVSGQRASYRTFEEWNLVQRIELSRLLPPSADEAIDGFEVALFRADAALRANDGEPLRALVATTPFLRSAWRAESARWSGAFTPYDGVFTASIARQRLAAIEWTLSSRRVQSYVRCPHRFFLEHVLKIEALEEPERVLTVSALDRGTLVHDILCKFYERAAAAGLVPLTPAAQPAAEALMHELASTQCRELEAEGQIGLPLLWQRQQRVLHATLRAFIAAEIAATDGFVPTHFEYGFGDADTSVTLRLPDNEVVRLRGRIDRVELAPDGRGRVVDYKTGRAAEVAPDVIEAETFQLPMYLHAVRARFPETHWQRADLFYINLEADFARVGLDAAAPAAQEAALAEFLAPVLRGIRAGYFPGGAPSCLYCAFAPICGRAAIFYPAKAAAVTP